MCCGGGRRRPEPGHEPHADCAGARKDFQADAWLIAVKNGLDLCSIHGSGAGGLVLRGDVERALGR